MPAALLRINVWSEKIASEGDNYGRIWNNLSWGSWIWLSNRLLWLVPAGPIGRARQLNGLVSAAAMDRGLGCWVRSGIQRMAPALRCTRQSRRRTAVCGTRNTDDGSQPNAFLAHCGLYYAPTWDTAKAPDDTTGRSHERGLASASDQYRINDGTRLLKTREGLSEAD